MPDFIEEAISTISDIPLVGPFIAPAAGFALGGPLGAAAASGLQTGIKTGDPLAGILSAGGSYAGGQIASNVLGDQLGTFGGTISDALGPEAGSFAGNILGPEIAGAQISSALGSTVGSNLASSLATNTGLDTPNAMAAGPAAPEPFSPKREDQISLPGSLSGFSGLSPNQLSSNIATQGVYGGGAGPEESGFFANLINRRLVDETGQVGDMSGINPIENSFLSQLGLGGFGNSNDLLEAISKRRASGGFA